MKFFSNIDLWVPRILCMAPKLRILLLWKKKPTRKLFCTAFLFSSVHRSCRFTQLSFLYLLILQFSLPHLSVSIFPSFLGSLPFLFLHSIFFAQPFQILNIKWACEKAHRTDLESFMWIKPCQGTGWILSAPNQASSS